MTTALDTVIVEQEEKVVGILVGVTKPDAAILEAKRPVSIGEYLIFTNQENKQVLGLIEKSYISSDALNTSIIRNYNEARESKVVAIMNERDKSNQGQIRILGYFDTLREKNKIVLPPIPPEPGTEVYQAPIEDLRDVFAPTSKQWVATGTLLRNEKVPVKVNISKIVSRHLAVLAMTGMGKSNLVSLLAREIAKINGTMVIFDYHGDYSFLDIGKNINFVQAKINPRHLLADKLAEVIDIQDRADKQLHVLWAAFKDEVKSCIGDDFWDKLKENVSNYPENNKKEYAGAAGRVLDKIADARRKYSNILDAGTSDPLTYIKNGKINIVNLAEFTEKQANAAVSFYLEELLDDRKKAVQNKNKKASNTKEQLSGARFPAPVLVVIEEAHVFIPKNENTDTKYLAAKIAREGRKFGLGLVIVSQRPRGLDVNILSQMGSAAVMKLIQQDDQAQVAAASESLSKDLIEHLTSLNPGEAIFSGQWVNIPAFVKVDEIEERKIGVDIDAVEAWEEQVKINEIAKRDRSDSFIPDGYIEDS